MHYPPFYLLLARHPTDQLNIPQVAQVADNKLLIFL
jgi:hypothetical protein